jgi:hypothetical protein
MKAVPWSARWVLVLACLAAFGPMALNAFEEPGGRFAIDLPVGWVLQPQTDQTVFVFQGPAAVQIVVQYVSGAASCAQLFQVALDAASTTLNGLAPEGKPTDLMVNGHPSHWEVRSGTFTAPNGVKVRLYALLGGVMLRGGGVAFQSYLSDQNRKNLEGIVKSAFATIRLPGEPVSGESDRGVVATERTSEAAEERGRPSSKVKLLVTIDSTQPLIVEYQSKGATIRSNLSILFSVAGLLTDEAIKAKAKSDESIRLQTTIGPFDRYPILDVAAKAAFPALGTVSSYFQVDVRNASSDGKNVEPLQPQVARSDGYDFALLLREKFAGLKSVWAFSTLSATSTISFELIDLRTNKTIAKGARDGANKVSHQFEDAFADRSVFIQEYKPAAGYAIGSIVGDLNQQGHLHEMAAAVGLGDLVPSIGPLLDSYAKRFDYQFMLPKGWHQTETATKTKYMRIIEPDNDDRKAFGLVFSVDLLIKEFGQDVADLQSYVPISVNRLAGKGYTPDGLTTLPLSLGEKYIDLVFDRPNKAGKSAFIFTMFGKEYVGVYELVFLRDFETYSTKYRSDIEYILTNMKFSMK